MKKPRLTDIDRHMIESMLKDGNTIYAIAKKLSRPASTIMREIKARAVKSDKGAAYRVTNRCAFKMQCDKRNICAHCPYDTKRQCKFCRQCNSICKEFTEQKCERLDKAPFVCNGCKDENKCVLRKRFYIHSKAHESYRTILSQSRSGANISEGERIAFDALLHEMTGKGQSVYAVMTNNPDKFSISLKTCYRYINSGLLTTKRHNLPNACKMKPRSAKSVEHKVDKRCRIGRTRDDYLKFIEENPGLRVVQMDTVEGVKGGKALLTLMFNPFGFMLAFLLENKTSECVIEAFRNIRSKLKSRFGEDMGREMFAKLFPVILTDNGTEFSNPARIEFDDDGSRLSFLFYCNPRASYEKAQCERNHVELRRVLPKATDYHEATSFDSLSQDDVSLMMSHVNSYVRKAIKGIPYDLFAKEYGEDVASLFGISRIDPNDVTLKPSLLGIEVKVKKWVLQD